VSDFCDSPHAISFFQNTRNKSVKSAPLLITPLNSFHNMHKRSFLKFGTTDPAASCQTWKSRDSPLRSFVEWAMCS